MSEIYVILIALGVATLWCYLMWNFVAKPTRKFYELVHDLEEDIIENDDKDGQLIKLYEADKHSWHNSTGQEIRRLASMMEIKYKINILKR